MNHTKTLTLILLTLLTAASGMATAQNRTEKRPRKLSTKKQLVIERQRADSLAALVEEYRRRESDWQKAWHDAQEQDERHHHVEQFAVDYTPARADSLAEQLRLQQVDDALQNFFNDYVCEPADMSTDTQLDSLYAARLKTLVSPIHLPYNQIVRTYIKRYTDGSGLMSRVLSLSQYYFPMIDEELLKAGLPVELHAMAIIESALSATAYSRAGAAGLWQFMPTTAKAYGLEVNSMVDERYDPDRPCAVFHTFANGTLRREIRRELDRRGIPSIDLLGPAVTVISTLTGEEPSHEIGAVYDKPLV